MQTHFHKMHGAGNDFVVFDGRHERVALSTARIAALADRRTGIGCDQLIVLGDGGDAAAAMRIFNPDGSEAGACGNATRCVAMLIAGDAAALSIRTAGGLLACRMLAAGMIEVDMGAPLVGWADIPLARPQDTLHLDLPGDPAACSMGNPHATVFVEAIGQVDPAREGPALEHDALFLERANIGFAQVEVPDRIRLRVWERGAGLTRACGSGACAALVNAHRRGLSGRAATLVLDGGTLDIAWRETDGHVLMAGPAVAAFQGSVDLSTYPA